MSTVVLEIQESSTSTLEVTQGKTYLEVNLGSSHAVLADTASLASAVSGGLLGTIPESEVSITTTTALSSTAFGRMHAVTGSSDYTITLPAVSGNGGKFIGFRFAQTAGVLVTVDGSGSELIGVGLTRAYMPSETAIYYCDGVIWRPVEQLITPYFRAERSANYTITDATWSVIQYNSEVTDNVGMYDPTTNYRVTLPRPGRWRIVHSIRFDGTTIVAAVAGILYNAASGTPTYLGYIVNTGAVATGAIEVSGVFAKGDYFQASAYCDATGSPQVTKANYTFFEAYWLGHT